MILSNWVKRLASTLGEPVIRAAVMQAMKIMGGQYVLGRTIEEGLKRGVKHNHNSSRYSFDMLGEGRAPRQMHNVICTPTRQQSIQLVEQMLVVAMSILAMAFR